jgi:2-succinyl-5-enolpyruvyl-6-hydroxy-3-cyclohexene-1-carboxylate synthase
LSGQSGLFTHKLHQPTHLPKPSVNACCLFWEVKTFENRIAVSKPVMACHFNFDFKEGFGKAIRQTYQPFRTTIFP